MDIIKVKSTVLFSAFLITTINCQANTDLPKMQMYVFNAEAENRAVADNPPAMKMVIYGNDDVSIEENDSGDYPVNEPEQEISLEFYADTGFRQDELDWTIAAPDRNPNILSELTWDNIEIITVGLGTTLRTSSNLVFNGDFVYGHIIDGNNQDSDFEGDNRTQEFSRSDNNADEGSVLDFSFSAGYSLDLGKMRNNKPIFSLIPKVGFSYHAQNFKMTNGVQVIPPTGNFPAVLDSSYDASWYGPWAGVDTQISFGPYFSILGSFEYHYAFYEATADWNLREDLANPESFTHEAEGTGINASIGSRINFNHDLSLNLTLDYKRWDADKKGIDTVFGADGTTIETGFNGVNWKSMGANLGLQYTF